MKIIATVNPRAEIFLVEMTKQELNMVCYGESYRSGSDFKVGQSFHVDKIYHRLKGLDANKRKLSGMAENLRSMANLLESTEPIMNELVEEEEETCIT